MTRGIFDPTGGETERSGSTHLGPEASNASRLPTSLTDGKAESDEAEPPPLAEDAEEAARRLRKLADGGPPTA